VLHFWYTQFTLQCLYHSLYESYLAFWKVVQPVNTNKRD